jgi:hypothetical protein
MNRRALLAAVPAVAFVGLAGLFYRGLSGDPTTLPSMLIGNRQHFCLLVRPLP